MNNDFIEEGAERLRRCLNRWFKAESKQLLADYPDAVEEAVSGWYPFANAAIYPYRSILNGKEVEGKVCAVDGELLCRVDWDELSKDFSLSQVEGFFLKYLGYRDFSRRRDKVERMGPWRWYWQEALLDCHEEASGKRWSLESTLQLQEVPESEREKIPAALVYGAGVKGEVEVYKERLSGGYVPYKPEEMRRLFIEGRTNKYMRALEVGWEQGKSYDELLAMSPEWFGLPPFDNPLSVIPEGREMAVGAVLGSSYYLYVKERNAGNPSLREISEIERVPYSKMMKAFIFICKGLRDGKQSRK